jgi:hypothetical protein
VNSIIDGEAYECVVTSTGISVICEGRGWPEVAIFMAGVILFLELCQRTVDIGDEGVFVGVAELVPKDKPVSLNPEVIWENVASK